MKCAGNDAIQEEVRGMKKQPNIRFRQVFIAIVTGILVAITAVNIVLTFGIASQQTEQLGQLRIQSVAAGLRKSLWRAEDTLARVCGELDIMLGSGASEEEIRQFLARQKERERTLADGTCLNIFCVVGGEIMISDTPTPEYYVLQDRPWYRGLMENHWESIYISPAYQDAFTDSLCFTVSRLMDDGRTIVGVDYSLDEVQAFVDELGDGYGEAVIVDGNETIIGHADAQMIGKRLSSSLPQYLDAFLGAAAGEDGAVVQTKTGGFGNAVFCSRTQSGWYVISSVSKRSLYGKSYVQLLCNCVVALLLVCVSALCGIAGIRHRRHIENKLHRAKEKRHWRERLKKLSGLTKASPRGYQLGITVIFLVTMVIAIGVNAAMTTSESRTKMESELQEYNYAIADWILEQKSILDMFANTLSARPQMLEDYEGMVAFLDSITRHYPKISATYIANPDFPHGHPMVMNNGWVPEPDYFVAERLWYIGALEAEGFSITEPYYDARTGEYCITFSRTVRSDSGELYGIFAIDFYLDVLMDILGASYSRTGYAFLVDKNGLIIDHPYSELRFSNSSANNIHDLVYDKLYRKAGPVSLRDYDGRYKVCISMDEPMSGFRLFVVKDWWSIYGDIFEYAALFLIVFGGCILAVNVVMDRMIRWQERAHERLKEAADSAIRAEQAKSQFFSNMSHEIRTPINAVLGMNEMILRECTDERLRSYAAGIQTSGRTLLSLINDLLDLSKIDSGKMKIVRVGYRPGELFMDLWEMIYLRAQQKGLSVSFAIDENMPSVLFGDDVRIKQIMTNLLTNAVKYTHHGGVELRASFAYTGEKMICLTFCVKDTGIGIKQEDLSRMFETFQRLDEIRNRHIEGSGLGMSITHSLLRQMDGSMQVESEYQKGTVFTVTLPQEVVDATPMGSFEAMRDQHRKNQSTGRQLFEAPEARVLTVDDNEMNLAVFQALLSRTKMTIDAADSGESCLQLARQQAYHLIFMDHMMPGMDGVQTLQELKKLTDSPNADTPVIALTANAIPGAREEYLAKGFADFLAKPIEPEQLDEMIVRHLPPELIRPAQEGGEAQETSPEDTGAAYGISVEQGLRYCAGSMDFYLDLIDMFLRDAQKLQRLEDLLHEGNLKEYGIQVHALKSNARTLGAEELADIAYEHELESKAGNAAAVKARWQALCEAHDRVREGLTQLYREHRGEPQEGLQDAVEGERLRLTQEELSAVADLIDSFAFDEAIRELKLWLKHPMDKRLRRRIAGALTAVEADFDGERASAILRGEQSA